MNFIDALKTAVPMEIRPVSTGSEYLEAVVLTRDIPALEKTLAAHLGDAHKVPGQTILFDDEMRAVVDAAGGVMIDQTLFYRKEQGRVLYAMLWPWQSDPSRVTLKAGSIKTAALQ